MYGRGTKSIAEQIKSHSGEVTKEDIKEAQEIQDNFFKSFPKVEQWIDKTHKDAKKTGYVEDAWGRRRRLPDIQLPNYEITTKDSISEFNPLLFSKGVYGNEVALKKQSLLKDLENCKYKKEVDKIKESALSDGYIVKDNGGFISQAERQCVNARIQGGAATMSKKAMINVYNSKELKDLGFKLLIGVHDELIGECPEENKEEVKQLLSSLMVSAALPEVTVPFKCDADDFKSWYLDVYTSVVKKNYNNFIQKMSKEEALNSIYEMYSECLPEELYEMLKEEN